MKVLMIGSDSSVKGGITSVINQLRAHDWASDGVEMDFIPTYIEANPVKKVFFFLKGYVKIWKYLGKNRPDTVHIHMSYKGSFVRKYAIHRLCVRRGIPDIIHLHGSEFEVWFNGLTPKKQEKVRRLLKESAAFIVLGTKWNEAVKRIEPSTKTVIVSNSVCIPDERAAWSENFKLLYMGVLIKRKGVGDLIDAVRLLKDDGRLKNATLTIAGTGALSEELKAKTASLGLSDVISFAGWTEGEEKKKLFRESQMLVLASYNEGLPIAVLEALSYGLPVVSANVGDIPSAVIDDESGYLVNPGDVSRLADRIYDVLKDKEHYEALSEGAYRTAVSKFSDKDYFATIRKTYEESVKA